MTTITVPRVVLEQALEALSFSCPAPHLMSKHAAAEAALRAALEKPEYPLGKATTDVGVPVYVVKKAEPVQEPVAWALHTGTKQGIKWNRRVEHGTPLYTAPPQRKPLTEDEIALIVADCSASAHRHDDFSFARAIERAHGIGGQDEP